jgi:hypothetical protein
MATQSKGIGRLGVLSFKASLIALTLVAFFASCVTQRKCLEKFPPVSTVDTVDHIFYRDTLVYVHLPGDTVVDSVTIDLPCPPAPANQTAPQRLRVKAKYASAEAWLDGNLLKLRLMVNDTAIAHTIDSAVVERVKEITNTQAHIKPVKYVPGIYKLALIVAIFAALLLVIKVVVTSLR